MESYQEFYEAFSLNPKNWFSQRVDQNNRELRSKARGHYQTSIKQLKELLNKNNYKVVKSDNGSYHVRDARKVGIDPSQVIKGRRETMYKKDPILSIPYIRTLFTLAHEVGHMLEWDENDIPINFYEFFDQTWGLENEEMVKSLKHIQQLWYELRAWVEGMQFIPTEYKTQYKKYAYDSYKSYMEKLPKTYKTEILLRNLLYQLNFDDHNR